MGMPAVDDLLFSLKLPSWVKFDIADQDPDTLFNTLLFLLIFLVGHAKILQAFQSSKAEASTPTVKKPLSASRIQKTFLLVFWSMRIAFWMSGPYFYAAYASKKLNGEPLSMAIISYISLTGYAAIALFGPLVGKISDQYGFKAGTIAAAVFYALGNLTITSDALPILFLGRALGGIGTCLMSSAPEAWLVSQFKQREIDPQGTWLRETFGRAYAFDSAIAIGAGQIAGWAAAKNGPTGPFQLSPAFLVVAALLTIVGWKEIARKTKSDDDESRAEEKEKQPTIYDALRIIRNDTKVLCLGGVQSLFEAAMYIFVLQWPPTMRDAIQRHFGESAEVPYGTIFSCFMACCMVGSSSFGWMAKSIKVELSSTMLLGLSAASMIVSAFASTGRNSARNDFLLLTVPYFIFEGCVGMYFPSMGILRSRYLPDSHRSLIMTLYGVPLNILVVTVYLYQQRLGCAGALLIAATALTLATGCMIVLHVTATRESRREKTKGKFKQAVGRVQMMNNFVRRRRSFRDSGIHSPCAFVEG